MFEGKPPHAPGAPACDTASGDAVALREMTWSDLRARLDAARDLRLALQADHSEEELASFDALSARLIAAQEGKQDINLDGLGKGKADGCMDAEPAGTGPEAPRGSQ